MVYFRTIRSGTIVVVILLLPLTSAGEGMDRISEDMVTAHNALRSKFDLPGLVWSEELSEHAGQWAEYLAEDNDCRLEHRPLSGYYGRKYGENLYWASPIRYGDGTREVQQVDAAEVVASWAEEAADFDYTGNWCREGRTCGHYTQMVWRATEQLGCAMAICPDKGQVWVCNYAPAGNVVGQRPY